MSVPTSELYKLAPSAVLQFFVLDATVLGGGVTRFHNGTNGLTGSVVWQGNTYTPFPIEATGFEITSQGTLPRPILRVSNVNGLVGGLIRSYSDLVGATLTRKRALVKHLDAVNFGGSNPTADSTSAFVDDVYKVERKVTETKDQIEFELASSADMHGQFFPRRLVQATICPWTYKGTECGYAGSLPTCSKTLADCTAHFTGTTGAATLAANSGANTYTRSTGSFITDGFVIGNTVTARGFAVSGNNGDSVVTAVAALTLTVNKALTTEAAAGSRILTIDSQLPFGGFPGAGLIL